MFDAGAAVGRLEMDISNWQKNIDAAKKDVTSISGVILRNAQTIRRAGLAIGAVGTAIAGVSILLLKSAADAEETANLFEVSFGSMADSAEEWAERTSSALGVNIVDLQQGAVVIQHLKARLRLSCSCCGARLGRAHTFCPGCGTKVEEAQTHEQHHRRVRTLPIDSGTLEVLNEYIRSTCIHNNRF